MGETTEVKKHILVTGCPRSGTTFLGKALSLPVSVGYVREPLNYEFGLEGIERYFPYIYSGMENEEHYNQLISSLFSGRAKFKQLPTKSAETLKRKIGRKILKNGSNYIYLKSFYNPMVRRLMIKDPIASLASEYIHQNYDVEVVMIVRHPIPVIASMNRVNLGHTIDSLVAQKPLYNKYLKTILGSIQTDRLSTLEQRALVWACLNYVLYNFAQKNPRFIVARHHDIAAKPVDNISRLYNRLGLNFSPNVKNKITRMTSRSDLNQIQDGNMHILKRDSQALAKSHYGEFSKPQLKTIHRLTDDVTKLFFDSVAWPQPAKLIENI